MMASQLASRIKSSLSRKRHSLGLSLASSSSTTSHAANSDAALSSNNSLINSQGVTPESPLPIPAYVVLDEAPSIASFQQQDAASSATISSAGTPNTAGNTTTAPTKKSSKDHAPPPLAKRRVLLDLTKSAKTTAESDVDPPGKEHHLHHQHHHRITATTLCEEQQHQQHHHQDQLQEQQNQLHHQHPEQHLQPTPQFQAAAVSSLHSIREHSTSATDRPPLPEQQKLDTSQQQPPPLPSSPSSSIDCDRANTIRPLTPTTPTINSATTPKSTANRRPAPPRRKSSQSSRPLSATGATLAPPPPPPPPDSIAPHTHSEANAIMPGATRKIWVKRPEASATLVTINEDDLVDDVRETILRKYANSLGRTFDSPDLNLRLYPRDRQRDRTLGPEEHISRLIDNSFPGGQTVDEALIIDIPRRTPKASPRVVHHHPYPHTAAAIYYDENRPSENGEGYFPPFQSIPSPSLPLPVQPGQPNATAPHSISVLGTGHIPSIPSPGALRARHHRPADRPRLGRTHTSSSTLLANGAAPNANAPFRQRPPHSRSHSNSSDPPGIPSQVQMQMQMQMPMPVPVSIPVMPKSPALEHVQPKGSTASTPPPPRAVTPSSSSIRPKKIKKSVEYANQTIPGPMNGTVPPINVLIVEDNPINLKLLEAFVKRLKVRWQTAMNGRDAVKKWRTGGFHLVLMDIQLPVMNGLEATREIRRLERVNSIGVFSSTPSTPQEELNMELVDQDRLENVSIFKGPVIIVALTASSLQSDRHEALAAGCNDFLTKPVNFVWLERKVMEWGCMQALIDFSGWRQWKDIAQEAEQNAAKAKAAAAAAKAKSKKNRSSLSASVAV